MDKLSLLRRHRRGKPMPYDRLATCFVDALQALVDQHTDRPVTGRGHWDGILCDGAAQSAHLRDRTRLTPPGYYHDVSTVDGEAWCTTCRIHGSPLRWNWHTGVVLVDDLFEEG
jgi:hypothetical protein